MGYYVNQIDSKFHIKKENYDNVLNAIKNTSLEINKMSGGSSSGQKWFSWVDMKELSESKTIFEAFDCWRWEVDEDEFGINNIQFNGEKLGDEQVLFEAIASYVEKDSYIAMVGEDGDNWRWYFNGEACEEQKGKVVYY